MKNQLLVVATVLLSSQSARAVTVASERGLTASTAAPISYVRLSSADAGGAALLFTASDLAAMPPNSSINSIGFEKTAGGAVSGTAFKMSIKNTAATSLTSASTLGAELTDAIAKVDVIKEVPEAAGWVDFAFSTPFVYTGGGIEVVLTWDSNSGPRNGASDLFWHAHTTSTTIKYLEVTGDALPDTSAQMYPGVLGGLRPRPNVRFDRDPVATPWLVVTSGPTVLVDGGSYSATSFHNGVAVPNTLHITNVGGVTATIGDFGFVNAMSVTLAAVTQPPATLTSGASADAQYTHTPTADSVTASYGVTFGSYDFTNQGFTGSGAAIPELDTWLRDPLGHRTLLKNGAQPYLGNLPVGSTTYYTGTIANAGAGALSLTGSVNFVAGAGLSLSDLVQPTATTIPPNGEQLFGFAVTVTSEASNTGVTVSFSNDDADEGSFQTQLKMNGVTVSTPATAPEISVTSEEGLAVPRNLPFRENVQTGQVAYVLRYNVQNTGDGPLGISNVVISGHVGCTTSILHGLPSSIAAQGTDYLGIDVTRTEDDEIGFTVTITNTDGDEGTYSFDVLIPPYLSPNIDARRASGGPEISDTVPTTFTFTIENDGNDDLHVSGAFLENMSNVSGTLDDVTSTTLAPHGTMTATATIAPGQVGPYSFDLVIESDDPDSPHYTVAVSGTIAAGKIGSEKGGCVAAAGSPLLVALALAARALRRRRLAN